MSDKFNHFKRNNVLAKDIFVVGSGTGIGKTFVSAILLAGFAKLGYGATYMKPVETGCEQAENGKIQAGPDVLFAFDYICDKYKSSIDLHSPYRFIPACSPHLAASESGCEICIDNIVSTYKKLKKETSAKIILIEGAGGVLVPLNNKEYMIDVMKALAIPAVLVVDSGLGTLNHTFMSIRMLELYEIQLAGVIINNAKGIERDFIYEDNVKTIYRHIHPLPCLDVGYNDVSVDCHEKKITEFCNEIISGV